MRAQRGEQMLAERILAAKELTVVCEQNVSNSAKMDGKYPQNDETCRKRVTRMEEKL